CLGLLALGSVAALADDAATTPAPTDPKDMKQVKAPAEKPPTPVTCRIGAPLWVSAISGSVGARGRVTNASYVSFSDLYNHLDYAIPGSVELGYGKWGLLVDGQYTKLSDTLNTRDVLFSSASIQMEQAFAELNISYKVVDTDKFTLSPFVGTRFEYVRLSGQASATRLGHILGAPDNFDESGSKSWADPILGLQMKYQILKSTALVAKADVGGFGAASHLTYEAFGGSETQITRCFWASAGYRYLQTNYSSNGFTWNIAFQGPQIMFGVNF
ncbi:MAG: hypothetical protein LV480_00005, partial [Methylacidiphilales bacterium]|nr:hypothetical protein [Candidatus Methylacidiphilales bacterium]